MSIDPIPIAPVSLIIRPAGAHKFEYTKVENTTGEALWRWPLEPPLSRRIEAKGQLLDVTA